jgi:hypothetical protein
MLGRSTARVSALLCILLLSSVCAFGSDATGVLHPSCHPIYQYVLEITTFQGHHLEKTIQFDVLGENAFESYANQWLDSPKRGDAKLSRVQIVHLSHHWWRGTVMSGNFEIEYGDGK